MIKTCWSRLDVNPVGIVLLERMGVGEPLLEQLFTLIDFNELLFLSIALTLTILVDCVLADHSVVE